MRYEDTEECHSATSKNGVLPLGHTDGPGVSRAVTLIPHDLTYVWDLQKHEKVPQKQTCKHREPAAVVRWQRVTGTGGMTDGGANTAVCKDVAYSTGLLPDTVPTVMVSDEYEAHWGDRLRHRSV